VEFVKITTGYIGILFVCCFCGCSSFNGDWKRAAKQPLPADSVEGRWEGQWIIEANHHHGKLLCLMEHETNSLYAARFHATYAGFLHFNYRAHLEMHPHDIGWEFDGEANLGTMAGGSYYYEGRATTTNFVSTYRSKYDHGRFEMQRP